MKKIAYLGIITVIIYFIIVGLFLITKNSFILTIWELITIISSFIMLIIIISLSDFLNTKEMFKKLAMSFAICTCALTSIAHIVDITVTRYLIESGKEVPTYFQIGFWPSTESAIDYFGWGIFMGLALLCLGISNDKKNLNIKYCTIISGSLCILGFIGCALINENLWYVAPLGYGVGSLIICIMVLRSIKNEIKSY